MHKRGRDEGNDLRLDVWLFENGFSNSRNKSSEMIKSGEVRVDGKIIKKPSFDVFGDENIETLEKKHYVSRAGYKLKGFLQELELDIEAKECLDVGSSTGGFVEVLLEYGAKRVTCVDVGSMQLHLSLRDNPKVEIFENCDIREFEHKDRFDVLTCDVSFISISQLLYKLDKLAKKDIIILFKPQFEVGVGVKRDKKGVVKDRFAISKAKDNFEASCFGLGWKLVSKRESVLRGKEGNEEFFYYYTKK